MDVVTRDAIAMLNTAMEEHNEDDCIRVLKSVVDIAESSKIQQESLGSNGGCEAIYYVIKNQIHNPDVCEIALWALSRMCRREQDQHFTACVPNIARFGEVGVCPEIVQALRVHSKHAGVVAACLRSIANMSSMTQSNKTSLREAGSCEAVVQALKYHTLNPTIAEQSCWVMTFLACDHPDNKVRLGRAGACEAVIATTSTHMGTTTVLCRAFGAAAFLAKGNDVNRDHLLELNVCDLAVESLHRHRHHKGLLQVVCHVLLYLYYCQCPDKLSELKSAGALDSRGWVIDIGYDSLLNIWKPDAVIEELKDGRKSMGGFCSFIICT